MKQKKPSHVLRVVIKGNVADASGVAALRGIPLAIQSYGKGEVVGLVGYQFNNKVGSWFAETADKTYDQRAPGSLSSYEMVKYSARKKNPATHSAKWKRCVRKVKASAKKKGRKTTARIPNAVCTTALAEKSFVKKNPVPPIGFAIFARKGNGPRMHYDGKKFSNNGLPKLYARADMASNAGRGLIQKYPLLRSYRVTVEPAHAGGAKTARKPRGKK